MKHLILDNANTILQIGDEYSTPTDADVLAITGEEKPMHKLDELQYDFDGFIHVEALSVPDYVVAGEYKFENGEFVAMDPISQAEGTLPTGG